MALISCSRLVCRRNLTIKNLLNLQTLQSPNVYKCIPLRSAASAVETHDQKNERLGRPLSPHLTIYSLQLTSTLSVTHRATGIVLSGYAMILGFGTLFVPGGIPCMIAGIQSWGLPTAALVVGKALFAFPLTFHYFNGIRHLSWDLGRFLSIKEVYSTGWTITSLAALSAMILALM